MILVTLVTAIVFYFAQAPFFWDTIQLGSKHAFYYYESGCGLTLLPEEINSGHIPFFGYYIAVVWTIFGKSLIVSHLAVLPFALAIVYFLYCLLGRYILDRKLLFVSTAMLLFDPTLLAQISLVSPELVLVAGLLMVLEGRETKSGILQIVGLVLLSLISIRGIVVAGCLGLWMLWTRESMRHLIKVGMPAAALVVAYYVWHYSAEGWIGVHDGSPWKASISLTSIKGWIYNVGLMIWRLIDFGRVIWIGIGGLLLVNVVRSQGRSVRVALTEQYFKLLVVLFLAFVLLTTPFAGLTGHRYYLPVILVGLFLVLRGISQSDWSRRTQLILVSSLLLLQCMSHFIVYPRDIAQGWDSSLAYVPYQTLVDKMEDTLRIEGIDCSEVGTYFPLRGNRKYRTLDDQHCIYPSAMIGNDRYIVTSNIMNTVSREDYQRLEQLYEQSQRWQTGGVELILHKIK